MSENQQEKQPKETSTIIEQWVQDIKYVERELECAEDFALEVVKAALLGK